MAERSGSRLGRWDFGALARAAEVRPSGGELPAHIEAVGTDTRSLPPACLFVALTGDNFDGHQFVRQAVAKGALAVMIEARVAAEFTDLKVPRLVVSDTRAALAMMARQARGSLQEPVVAVTGSNGKTTTKELIAAALSDRIVHKTTGNLNNLLGVPLTILAWPTDAQVAVIEMGMSAPGEIAELTLIAQPTVGVITNVGPAHLEGVGTIEDVARAKGELFANLPARGTAIINADDPIIGGICVPLISHQAKLTFGRSPGCDVRIDGYAATESGSRIRLIVQGTPMEIHSVLPGPHNAMNTAAATAAAIAIGTSLADIEAGLLAVKVPGGRMRVVAAARELHLVDDTYNANPYSMRAAFVTLAELASGRRIAVLGDMLELGDESEDLHREVGRAAATSGIGWVLTLGAFAQAMADGASNAGASAHGYDTIEALLADLDGGLRPGDWVLVKGSRGMHMERVVELLMKVKA